jgi:hypothetical protein
MNRELQRYMMIGNPIELIYLDSHNRIYWIAIEDIISIKIQH